MTLFALASVSALKKWASSLISGTAAVAGPPTSSQPSTTAGVKLRRTRDNMVIDLLKNSFDAAIVETEVASLSLFWVRALLGRAREVGERPSCYQKRR